MRIRVSIEADVDPARIPELVRLLENGTIDVVAPGRAPADPALIRSGLEGLGAVLTLWGTKGFPSEKMLDLLGVYEAGILALVREYGGIINATHKAVIETGAWGGDVRGAVAELPTLLTMISALGVGVPPEWFREDYSPYLGKKNDG